MFTTLSLSLPLDFVVNRFFMKLFTTNSIETIKYYQVYFYFALPSVLWAKRVSKYLSIYKAELTGIGSRSFINNFD